MSVNELKQRDHLGVTDEVLVHRVNQTLHFLLVVEEHQRNVFLGAEVLVLPGFLAIRTFLCLNCSEIVHFDELIDDLPLLRRQVRGELLPLPLVELADRDESLLVVLDFLFHGGVPVVFDGVVGSTRNSL